MSKSALRKIESLRSRAESTTFQGEADNCESLARKLCEKHGLDFDFLWGKSQLKRFTKEFIEFFRVKEHAESFLLEVWIGGIRHDFPGDTEFEWLPEQQRIKANRHAVHVHRPQQEVFFVGTSPSGVDVTTYTTFRFR